MQNIKDTKVFSDAYELSKSIFKRSKNYSKHFRPTLGRRLEDASIDLLSFLKTASVTPKDQLRFEKLRTSSNTLNEIRVLLQLSRDLGALSSGGYEELSELTSTIGRQIGGFLKYDSQKNT